VTTANQLIEVRGAPMHILNRILPEIRQRNGTVICRHWNLQLATATAS
jgi:hypothetical protein